jgi:Tol biopolymer transport system component
MKKSAILTALLMIAAFAFGSLVPQNGYDQFQKALAKERGEGNLEEAIALYQKVIEETKDESLAAQAQFRIGICYEKLGQEKAKQAQEAFQKVVDKYPTQTDTVKMAREKLVVLARTQAPRQDIEKSLLVRKLCDSDSSGSLSPDGSLISFADWGLGNLAVRELATGRVRHLTKNAKGEQFANLSIISPDNQKIAYSWYGEDGLYSLWLINLDGSGNRPLFRGQSGWHIEPSGWSPDGKKILAVRYLSYPPRACQIVTVSVSDGSMKVLKELGRRIPTKMSFSPDGRFIVYDYPPDQSTCSDIYLLAADGGEWTPLVENPANDYVLGWTPSGKHVMFASDRAGSWGAWIVPLENGKVQEAPKLVKQDIGQIKSMGFTRDGSFYYGIGGWTFDVYTQEVDLNKGRVLGEPALAVQRFVGSNSNPSWSPDGQYLAYISKRSPAAARAVSGVLCIRALKSGEERELLPELDWFNILRWSPDGRHLMAQGFDRTNHLGEYLIDALTGSVSPVLQEEKDDYHETIPVEWSKDGQAIYFVRNNSSEQRSEIILRDLKTAQETPIAALKGKNWYFIGLSLSPDGGRIAARIWDENKKSTLLAFLSSKGGETQKLLELEGQESISGFAWTPDSRQLLFVKKIRHEQSIRGRSKLWLLSAENGEYRKLEDLMTGVDRLSIHPDGRRLAFSTHIPKSEVWIMENFLPGDSAQGKDKRQRE